MVQAQLVKKQLEETKSLTIKLENKEADIKELRKALKAKQEELSEMQIRRELGERKLTSAARDAELKAEQLQRKLEDANNQLKRKEKEFEETMDHLQQDIDSLESERGQLRDKLKLYAKRGGASHVLPTTPAAVRDLSPVVTPLVTASPKHSAQTESPVKVSSGVGSGGEVNEALQHQLKVLSWTIERERAARIAACRKAERAAVLALRPLENPCAPAAVERRRAATLLEQDLAKLQTEWTLFVARSGLVKFPDDPAKYGRVLQQHREKQREIRRLLEERLVSLQAEALSSPVEVGTLQYPASPGHADQTVYVTRQQLDKLRELVTELKSDEVKLELKPLDVSAA
ncbi:dynactin subunit 1 [Phthorimaea operculella]|nr:dynactin subunit 1 [Phthorimaea operculella]